MIWKVALMGLFALIALIGCFISTGNQGEAIKSEDQ